MGKSVIFYCDIKPFKEFGEELLDIAACLKDKCGVYHVLLSLGVEILLKSIVALDIYLESKKNTEQEIREEITNALKKLGHELDKIFEKIFKKHEMFKSELNISEIKKVQNDFLSDFRIKFNDHQIFSIKNLEGIRYLSFAKNKTIFIQCPTEQEIEFIKKIKNAINKIFSEHIEKNNK
jgi:phosphotransferase system HPr-like phosphotransfer protein